MRSFFLMRAALVASVLLIMVGTTGHVVAAPVAAADITALPVTERMVWAGDVELFVRATGGRDGGPALVMVNGGPGLTHDYLEALEDELASIRLRVVTYDQRGTGRSTAPSSPDYSLTAYVRDLSAVRAALNIEQLHLLGHSFGGLVTQAYTAAHPNRVRSLTLAASEPTDPRAAAAGDRRFDRRILLLTGTGQIPDPIPPVDGDDCSAQLAAITPAFFADPDFVPQPGTVATECRQNVIDQTTNTITNDVLADVQARLGRYRGPALLVMGRGDPFGPAWGIRPQQSALSSADVSVALIRGAGHLPWLESTRFVPIVHSFLVRST